MHMVALCSATPRGRPEIYKPFVRRQSAAYQKRIRAQEDAQSRKYGTQKTETAEGKTETADDPIQQHVALSL